MARQALIKLRRGTGAPSDGTLAEGELAIDIAAKKLYTANSTGNTLVISGDQYNLTQSGNASHGIVNLQVDNAALSNDSITITGGTDVTVAGNSSVINVNSTSTLSSITGRGATTSTTIVGNGGFTGDLTGNVTGDVTGDLTGNADTATSAAALTTARNIGGVSFDGSADINLPGVNTSGNQDTSGNAATATALETARNIQGVSFDGTADITTLTAGDGTSVTGTAVAVVAGTGVTSNATGVHIGQSVGTTDNVQFNNVDVDGTLDVAGITTIEDTTASSSTGTGALVVAGGAGIAGALYVGGNLIVEGTTTQVSSTTVTIDDNLIKLAANQTGNDTDAVDTGVYSTYDVGGTQKYSGFVRDTSKGNKAFIFFEGITTEPTGTVTYAAGDLAYIEAILDGGTY